MGFVSWRASIQIGPIPEPFVFGFRTHNIDLQQLQQTSICIAVNDWYLASLPLDLRLPNPQLTGIYTQKYFLVESIDSAQKS